MPLRRNALPWCASLLLGVYAAGCQREQEPQDDAIAVVAQGLTAADCPSGYTVITGTNGADTLNGGAGNDCVVGLGGNDVIHGNGGNDFLIGGNGSDQLYGDDGNDQLFGEAGEDTINGGVGNDAIRGGDGVDTVHGNDGADRIFGESGNDQLYGDAGNDVIDGGANADTIRGGDGDDVIDGDLANDTLYGENGEDVLIGGAGSNTSDGGPGTDACSGLNCELPAMTPSGCTQDAQCSSGKHCVVDIGLCLGCLADADNDGVCNSADGCPNDANKTAAGSCGCGVSDADGDGDGVPSCNDGCPSDPNKISQGVCGCGFTEADTDLDGTPDCADLCSYDPNKLEPGICGCGFADEDSDGDAVLDCFDGCPQDPNKLEPLACGCGVADADGDQDGTPDCNDGCVADPNKTSQGACGCGVADVDSDLDGLFDCQDSCPTGDNSQDSDHDGVADGCDICPGRDDSSDLDHDGAPDGCPFLVVAKRNALPGGSVGLADFDEDCDVDAVVGGEEALELWSNDGSGAFSANSPTSVLGQSMGVAAGDLDGDGHADVAIRRSSWPSTTLSAAYGDGAGGFIEQGTPLDDGAPYDKVRLADVTGDGVLDAVAIGESSLVVSVGATPPARGFVETISGPPFLGPSYAVQVATGDLDFDGDAEVLVIDGEQHCSSSCSRDHDLFVYDFEAPGALAREQLGRLWSGGEVYGMALGDVTGDPALDLVLVSTSCDWPYSCSAQLSVYTGIASDAGSGAGLSGEHAAFVGSGSVDVDSSVRPVLADVAVDDKLEIIAAGYASTKVYWVDSPTFASPQLNLEQILDAGGSQEAQAADLDGDGARDLLIYGSAGGWQWWRGVTAFERVGPDRDDDGVCDVRDACPNGSNTLDDDSDGIPDGCDPCPGDPGNDPDHDGFCALYDSCPGHNSVDSDGDGMPNACDDCPVDAAPYDDQDGDGVCDTGDLCPGADDTIDADQDGVPDGCPALMLGPTTDDAKAAQWSMRASTAGDFDQDCHADVVLASSSTHRMEQWSGDGAGHFQLSREVDQPGITGPIEIMGMTSADFDADGMLDVVAWTNYSFQTNDSELGVWYGAGSDGFPEKSVSNPSSRGYDIELGDIDGDGALDAVYADNPIVRARLGSPRSQGSGGFGPELDGPNLDPGNIAASSIAVADFDGDGAAEVVAYANGGLYLHELEQGQLVATSLGSANVFGYLGFIHMIAADFNGDGRVDLLAGSYLQPYQCPLADANDCGVVQLYWGVDPAAGGDLWSPNVAFNVGGYVFSALPAAMKAADLTGDSNLEVVIAGMDHVSVITIYGGPTEGGPIALQSFKQMANGISTADVNSDGATDVIVSAEDGLHTYLAVDPSKQVGSSCP